jgi:hypothetical protein
MKHALHVPLLAALAACGPGDWPSPELEVDEREAGIEYQPAIVIRSGNRTYTGNWESTSNQTPAVTIATTEPVVIDGCNLRSKGDLVRATVAGARVTIRNCYARGLHPGVKDKLHGFFLYADSPSLVVVENNRMERTRGVLVRNWRHATGEVYRVRFNEVVNIEGRYTSSSTGYQTDHNNQARLFGAGNVHDVAGGVEVAWNRVTNRPGMSAVEDTISFYGSGGSTTVPYLVHDNLIDGAFGAVPSTGYSGGGIITDGEDGETSTTTDQYIVISDNIVLDSLNYGVKISQGHHNKLLRNIAIRDGRFLDGTAYISSSGVKVNAGSGLGLLNAKGTTFFASHEVRDNRVGWYDPRTSSDQRNYNINSCSGCVVQNNTSPYSNPLTDDEDAARALFASRVAAAGVTIGPRQAP